MSKISDSSKEEAIHHIVKELWCLRTSHYLLQSRGELPKKFQTAVFSAAFNDFLLHYRCLVNFFRLGETREDDVLAKHYVQSWELPPMPAWDEWRSSLSKLLAHLTYARCGIRSQGTGLDDRREFPKMREEIEAAWEKFTRQLPDTYKRAFQEELAKVGM